MAFASCLWQWFPQGMVPKNPICEILSNTYVDNPSIILFYEAAMVFFIIIHGEWSKFSFYHPVFFFNYCTLLIPRADKPYDPYSSSPCSAPGGRQECCNRASARCKKQLKGAERGEYFSHAEAKQRYFVSHTTSAIRGLNVHMCEER